MNGGLLQRLASRALGLEAPTRLRAVQPGSLPAGPANRGGAQSLVGVAAAAHGVHDDALSPRGAVSSRRRGDDAAPHEAVASFRAESTARDHAAPARLAKGQPSAGDAFEPRSRASPPDDGDGPRPREPREAGEQGPTWPPHAAARAGAAPPASLARVDMHASVMATPASGTREAGSAPAPLLPLLASPTRPWEGASAGASSATMMPTEPPGAERPFEVHVSIGRIELGLAPGASRESVPRREPQERASTVPLADYLAQGAGRPPRASGARR